MRIGLSWSAPSEASIKLETDIHIYVVYHDSLHADRSCRQVVLPQSSEMKGKNKGDGSARSKRYILNTVVKGWEGGLGVNNSGQSNRRGSECTSLASASMLLAAIQYCLSISLYYSTCRSHLRFSRPIVIWDGNPSRESISCLLSFDCLYTTV